MSTPESDNLELATYVFPQRRLKSSLNDSKKDPLVLVACGSFNPTTFLHLRMFEMAHDHVLFSTDFEVVGSFLSPVSDAYGKKGLASAKNRIDMCEIAVDTPFSYIEVDKWEASKDEYSTTAVVLDHFKTEINSILEGGYETADGKRKPAKIALLAGADLVDSMNTPGVWSEEDLHYILGNYPLFILERMGTDLSQTIAQLERFNGDFHIIPQLIQNDVSSTKIRFFRKQGMSIRYLVPDNVIAYIEKYGLYKN